MLVARASTLAALILGVLAFAPVDAYLRPVPRAARVSEFGV